MENPVPIVTDECVDYEITLQLRKAGFEVYAICEQSPSIKDEEVLDIAFQKKALLITEDKDFGELAFRLKLPNHGILLVRMMEEHSKNKAEIVLRILQQYNNSLLKAFSVVEKDKFRTRNSSP